MAISVLPKEIARGPFGRRNLSPQPSQNQKLPSSPSTQRRLSQTICSLLITGWVLLAALSPRIPLDIDVGRRVDLRWQELLLLPMLGAALALAVRRRLVLRSPWGPWLLASALTTGVSLMVKVMSTSNSQLLGLGYTYRFLIFFVVIFVVFALASSARTDIGTWLLVTVATSLILNSGHIIVRGLRGETTSFDLNGVAWTLYTPGLIGEPNPLTAGTFFLFTACILAAHLLVTHRNKVVLSLGILLSLISIYFTNNRAVFFGSIVFLLIFSLLLLLRHERRLALIWTLGIFVVGLSYFRLNWRGQAESPLDAIETGRVTQWQTAIDLLSENPFFGWELGTNETHQAIIRFVGELGIFGAVIFGVLIWRILAFHPQDSLSRYQSSSKSAANNLREQAAIWNLSLKLYLSLLLIMGLLTDSFTPVLSWDLLAFSIGIAWYFNSRYRAKHLFLNRSPKLRRVPSNSYPIPDARAESLSP